jgi:hypothetical protein
MKSNTLVHFHAMLLAGALEMDPIVRRSTIGIASGLICSVALVATLHSLFSGVALGVAIGTLYAIAVRPTPFAYAESIFTAGALAIPLWIVLSVIVFPTVSRWTLFVTRWVWPFPDSDNPTLRYTCPYRHLGEVRSGHAAHHSLTDEGGAWARSAARTPSML